MKIAGAYMIVTVAVQYSLQLLTFTNAPRDFLGDEFSIKICGWRKKIFISAQ